MSKLTLNTLEKRAEVIESEELLKSICGGTENSCHDQETEISLLDIMMEILITPIIKL